MNDDYDDLGSRGRRLWDSLLERDPDLADEQNPAREVAQSACRTADRVERLETKAAGAEPTLQGKAGMVTNPLYIEVRNQAALLARLIAALRLPDVAAGKRPQHHLIRGVQTNVGLSSLDRARAAKSS